MGLGNRTPNVQNCPWAPPLQRYDRLSRQLQMQKECLDLGVWIDSSHGGGGLTGLLADGDRKVARGIRLGDFVAVVEYLEGRVDTLRDSRNHGVLQGRLRSLARDHRTDCDCSLWVVLHNQSLVGDGRFGDARGQESLASVAKLLVIFSASIRVGRLLPEFVLLRFLKKGFCYG